MNMNTHIDVKPNIANLPSPSESESRAGATTPQPLSDFLQQLEDYVPTVPDAVTANFLNSAGFDSCDARVARLVALAAQKFISDIANDALQHCKVRSSNQASKTKGKDRRYALTMEDLTPALGEYGVQVRKPHYYV